MSSTSLRTAAVAVAEKLIEAGYETWFVGGCVRDQLLGLPEKDFDFATDARPEQVGALFPGARFVGARFGVSIVPIDGFHFEIATFRRDGAYLDHRHPETVSYGTLEEDASRRDFTVNALFAHPLTGELRDLHGGLADLKAGILRAVGDPALRFREDALRLLRAIRFATRLGFQIEPATWSALCDHAHLIDYISPERQRDELTAMLIGRDPARALDLLGRSGLLEHLLPEVAALRGVEQGRTFHPEGDAYTHTLLVVERMEERTAVTAWAALLHDVGKAPTFRRDATTGKISFHDHQEVGAEMARVILNRLRFPSDFISTVCALVARHMTFMNVTRMNQSTLRRFLGAPTIDQDLTLHRADCLGSNGNLAYWEFCRERLAAMRAEPAGALPEPLLNGRDLIALGYPPGPGIGKALKALYDRQLEGEFADREAALAAARAMVPEG